jgi:hypothetical protein
MADRVPAQPWQSAPERNVDLAVVPVERPGVALLENLRSALPGTTIIAAIHDRTPRRLPMPADATVRLAAGRVLRVT